MTILPLDFGGPTDRPFTPFPASALEDSILDRFRAIAHRHAGRLAIDDGHQRLTYGEVRARVERLAGLLMTGLPPGADPVAIFLDHYAFFPIAMLAVLAAGRAYVPLDVSFPLERNRRILQHASSAAIVTDHANALLAAKLCPPGTPLIDMEALDAIETPIPQMPTADSLAYILYTSGSTGEPKGVYQNHRNLLHDVLQYTNSIHLSTEDRLTMLYSGCVNGAIRDIYGALLNGASLHILSFRQLGATGLVAAIAEHGITIYHSVPTVFRQLVAALRTHQRLSDIRLAYLAGDRLDRADVDALRRHFPRDALLYTGIGSTENATLYRHWFIASDTPMEGPRVPVGRAIPDRDMALLDERGTPVPEGETGEIQVTSRYLALGYWRAPELTRMAFSEAPHDPRARVFRTGDLGRLRPDGLLEFMGRKDHQVKIRGFRVELGAIEAALKQASWIRDAAGMAHEDRSGDQRLVAYVVADPTHHASIQSLRQALKLQLPDHMIPTTVKVLERLPLTPNGKLDRAALPAPTKADRRVGLRYEAPRTETEWLLARIWAELLGVERIGRCDHFFDLGGHSLLATQLVVRIERHLECRLPLTILFDASTLAALATYIDNLLWLRLEPHARDHDKIEL